jgi:phage shock protein E
MKKSITFLILTILIAVIVFGLRYDRSEPGDLSPDRFITMHDERTGIVIDVRTPEEFEEGHLMITDHNYNFLSGEFEEKLKSFEKNETYYLYCRTGNRSGQAMEIMKQAGFENVYNIGGFEDLVSSGLPANE